jgi:hypothetical protein
VAGDPELVIEACYLAADVWSGMTEIEEPQTELLRELTASANRSGNPEVRQSAGELRQAWGLVFRASQNPGSPTALEDFSHALEAFLAAAVALEEQCEPLGVRVRSESQSGAGS